LQKGIRKTKRNVTSNRPKFQELDGRKLESLGIPRLGTPKKPEERVTDWMKKICLIWLGMKKAV
jgi:hypothetical protein